MADTHFVRNILHRAMFHKFSYNYLHTFKLYNRKSHILTTAFLSYPEVTKKAQAPWIVFCEP